jgi:hypothetical protein
MKSARIALLATVIGLSGCVVVPADHWYGERHWDHDRYSDHHWDRDGFGDHRHWDWDRDRDRHQDWR